MTRHFHFVFQDQNNYGIDIDGPIPDEFWDGPLPAEGNQVESVSVPETAFPIELQHMFELYESIDPLRPSDYFGADIYIEVVEFIRSRAPITQ